MTMIHLHTSPLRPLHNLYTSLYYVCASVIVTTIPFAWYTLRMVYVPSTYEIPVYYDLGIDVCGSPTQHTVSSLVLSTAEEDLQIEMFCDVIK